MSLTPSIESHRLKDRQMISATADKLGDHEAHYKGLAAILSSKSCDREFLSTAKVFEKNTSPLLINSMSDVLIVILTSSGYRSS